MLKFKITILILSAAMFMACAATPTMKVDSSITKEQAESIALKEVSTREKWGNQADVMNVWHKADGWHVLVSGYWLGKNGEHLSPVDSMDRYITIDDSGNVVGYGGTFD